MQLTTASMSTKKDSVVAPVIGSFSIVEPGFVANIAPDVAPSIEVGPRMDLHMREVFENPLSPPFGSPPALSNSPSHLEFEGDSSESSSGSAPT